MDSTFDNSFRGLNGAPYDQIAARIPENARLTPLRPGPNDLEGWEWTWKDGADTYHLKMHSPDPVAAAKYPGSNSGSGWIWQLWRTNPKDYSYYMDTSGQWVRLGEGDPNDLHIPMEPPLRYWVEPPPDDPFVEP